MASQEVKTFYFAGDSKVASSLGTSLEAAGFTKASVSEADVVFTYCVSESVRICTTTAKVCFSRAKRMQCLLI